MATGVSIDTDILSDEAFDLLCRVCKRRGKNEEAQKYCVECKDYYCLTCVNVHEDIPALTGHSILGKDRFPLGSIQLGSSLTTPEAPIERCDRHSHNCIDMYCQDHDDVGCGTCMAVDHRLCKDIFTIPEFLKTNTSTMNVKDIQQKLESVANTLTEYTKNFEREKQQMLNRKVTILGNINKFRKEINERLDELEKNTVAHIEDKYKALADEIEKETKLMKINNANITAVQEKLSSTETNLSQLFVNIKKGESVAGKVAKHAERNKPQITVGEIEFEADQRISDLLKEINTLGKIKQGMTGTAEYIGNCNTYISKKETLLQTIYSQKKCIMVDSDESRCNIVSACSLEDGTIILSDERNRKLKRLDSSTYSVTDYCDLPRKPGQVCSINRQIVAVCLPRKQEVHFVSVSNKMTLANKITTDFDCYGLAFAGGKLYISDSTSVYIYSVSGKKLKQFSKDMSEQQLFAFITSLAISADDSKIYVADNSTGLTILDYNGKLVGRYNGSQLRGAYGSCLTGSGSLLVCGENSYNVLQFGQDGKLIGEVVDFDDRRAQHLAICCNQQMSKMIVGKNRDEIEIFDLL